jgi:hypothetical protein
MKPQFLRIEFAASRMFVVVAVNFSVAFEADRSRVVDMVLPTARDRVDVIGLDLYSAKPMSDAATPVASGQQFGNLIPVEANGEMSYPSFLSPAIISSRRNLVPIGTKTFEGLRSPAIAPGCSRSGRWNTGGRIAPNIYRQGRPSHASAAFSSDPNHPITGGYF